MVAVVSRLAAIVLLVAAFLPSDGLAIQWPSIRLPWLAPAVDSSQLRVLIVEETADRAKLPPSQLAILTSSIVRAKLDAVCCKGADGKTPEWRILDKDLDAAGESALWQEAMKIPRESVPWLVVTDGVRHGYSGPLPKTIDETLAIVGRYAR